MTIDFSLVRLSKLKATLPSSSASPFHFRVWSTCGLAFWHSAEICFQFAEKDSNTISFDYILITFDRKTNYAPRRRSSTMSSRSSTRSSVRSSVKRSYPAPNVCTHPFLFLYVVHKSNYILLLLAALFSNFFEAYLL